MIAIAIAISNTTFKASITFVNKILIAGIMDEAVDLAGGGLEDPHCKRGPIFIASPLLFYLS